MSIRTAFGRTTAATLTAGLRPLMALLAGLLFALPAAADNAGRPMTFEWARANNGANAIFGDGDLTTDTPEALKAFLGRSEVTPESKLYLNSLGGDLEAGMELGRIIRDAKLNTGVGRAKGDPDEPEANGLASLSPVYPGYCVSACTLAFLGGVARRVDPGGTYAVHQVSMECVDKRAAMSRFPWLPQRGVNYCPELGEALSMVQIASGAVVEYVRYMGADPIFLTEMAKATPNTINALTEAQLKDFRINYTFENSTWGFETDARGQFFLKHEQGDQWKTHRIDFFCDRSRPTTPRLFMWMVHNTMRSTGRLDPAKIAALAAQGITASWQMPSAQPGQIAEIGMAVLEPDEIVSPPAAAESGNVTLTIDLSKRLRDIVMTADKFQLVTTKPEADKTTGFQLIAIDLDRDKLASISRSCQSAP
jgi:hypothetical protein